MWDERINETARDLTRGEPGGDFRARVLARIGDVPANAGGYGWRWLVASATMAAALAVLIFTYLGDRPVPTTAPDLAKGKDTPLAVGPVQPNTDRVTRSAAAPSINQEDSQRRRPSQVDPSPSILDGASAFTAAAVALAADPEAIVINPVTIDQVELSTLESPDLSVSELSIAPIEVPAIEASAQGQ